MQTGRRRVRSNDELGLMAGARKTMTFDEWWDSTKANATPDTYQGWEASCRQAWAVAALAERKRWEEALRLTCRADDAGLKIGGDRRHARST